MSDKSAVIERTSTRRQIQEMLRAEDKVSFSGSLGLFLRGLGWCAAAGFLIATVLWLMLGSTGVTAGPSGGPGGFLIF
jgi:hypothetical protein